MDWSRNRFSRGSPPGSLAKMSLRTPAPPTSIPPPLPEVLGNDHYIKSQDTFSQSRSSYEKPVSRAELREVVAEYNFLDSQLKEKKISLKDITRQFFNLIEAHNSTLRNAVKALNGENNGDMVSYREKCNDGISMIKDRQRDMSVCLTKHGESIESYNTEYNWTIDRDLFVSMEQGRSHRAAVRQQQHMLDNELPRMRKRIDDEVNAHQRTKVDLNVIIQKLQVKVAALEKQLEGEQATKKFTNSLSYPKEDDEEKQTLIVTLKKEVEKRKNAENKVIDLENQIDSILTNRVVDRVVSGEVSSQRNKDGNYNKNIERYGFPSPHPYSHAKSRRMPQVKLSDLDTINLPNSSRKVHMNRSGSVTVDTFEQSPNADFRSRYPGQNVHVAHDGVVTVSPSVPINQNRELKMRVHELEKQLSENKAHLHELQSQRATVDETCDRLRNQLRQKASEAERLRERVTSQDMENSAVLSDNAAARREKESLMRRAHAVSKELDTALEERDIAFSDRQIAQSKCAEAREKLALLQREIYQKDAIIKESKHLSDKLATRIEELEEHCRKIDEERQKATIVRDAMEKELHLCRQERDTVVEGRKTAEHRLQEVETTARSLRNELYSVQGKLSDAKRNSEVYSNEAQSRAHENARLLKEKEDALKAKQYAIDAANEAARERRSAEVRAQDAQDILGETTRNLEMIKRERDSLREQIRVALRERDEFETKMKEMRIQTDKCIQESSELPALRAQLGVFREELSSAQNLSHERLSELQHMKMQNRILEQAAHARKESANILEEGQKEEMMTLKEMNKKLREQIDTMNESKQNLYRHSLQTGQIINTLIDQGQVLTKSTSDGQAKYQELYAHYLRLTGIVKETLARYDGNHFISKANHDNEVQTLKFRINELQKDKEELNTRLHHLNQQLSDIRGKKMEQEVHQEHQVKEFESIHSKELNRINNLQRELKTLRNSNNSLDQERLTLKEDYVALQKSFNACTKQNEALEAKINDESLKLQIADTKRKWKEDVERLESECKIIREELTMKRTEYSNEIERMQRIHDQELDAASQASKTARALQATQESKILIGLQEALEEEKRTKSMLKSEIVHLKDRLANDDNDLQTHRNELLRSAEKRRIVQQKLDANNEELSKTKQELIEQRQRLSIQEKRAKEALDAKTIKEVITYFSIILVTSLLTYIIESLR